MHRPGNGHKRILYIKIHEKFCRVKLAMATQIARADGMRMLDIALEQQQQHQQQLELGARETVRIQISLTVTQGQALNALIR